MVIAGDVLNVSISSDVKQYDTDYVPYDERLETYIVPVIFSLILVVGVMGNGILVLILLRHANMRNIPNTYVLSLALGDLLVIVTCVPFTSILYTIESWPWGLTICKLSECAKDISIGVSVFTLAALSAERYCAIVNPIRRHVAGLSAKPLTILTASLIWVLAIVLAMPDALFSYVPVITLEENRSILICSPFPEEFGNDYKKGMVMFKFLVYYAIPLCVIAAFYLGMARHLALSTRNMPGELPNNDHRIDQLRTRRRVSRMVVCFIIVFVICFLPYHVFMLWFHFCSTSQEDYDDFWHAFRIIGFCLSFSNSCVNPIALYLISRTFRHRFNKYLCHCLPCRFAICGGRQIDRGRVRSNGGFSQRSRGDMHGTFYDNSFGSTFRRRTQEFNSTAVFEMGSVETTRPTPNESNQKLRSVSEIRRKTSRPQAPCLEDGGDGVKRVKGIERDVGPNTKEYLELALTRVLELQREIKEDTYIAETDNGSSDLDASGSEEDLTKEILAKVFQDLPGASSSIAKIMDNETRWETHRMNVIHSKRIQLLGFDTCRRMALDFMKNIVRESRNRSASLDTVEPEYLDLPFQRNEPLPSADENLASDLRKRETNAEETRARMLKSLDLHLATKQRDYTAKLMRSGI
ncbi:Neuromedin-B receptor [Ooceraea biroi]|uniref:Neuromedin-B receptor n=1 Tax=Ooceraea biroi TaxID=2015173 RepID=A0A026WQH4_OOCBI|nr:Neuromedin-B receptor [Ooceraea biroi]